MLRSLLLALLFLSLNAVDHPSAFWIQQWNEVGDDYHPITTEIPSGMPNCVFGFDGSTKLPRFYTFGSGITTPGGVITVSAPAVAWGDVTGKPTFATVATSGSYNDLTNKPTLPAAPAQASASHSIGTTGWQVHSTRNALVFYSTSITTSVTLGGGASGYITMEIASNSTFTANLQEVARTPDGLTGTVIVGVGITSAGGGQLSGFVPAGYYVRLRSVTSSGTPTYAYLAGQEILY